MKYWILKTEPETYSYRDLMRDKKTSWDGVRNFQARNYIKTMQAGDLAVVYESVGPKAAVGIAKILDEPYRDPSAEAEEDWSTVDIAPVKEFKTAVSLTEMKADAVLKSISLIKQSRLSVCPISKQEFERLTKLGGL
jgi:predicted RNA-binding protein with PUA-like domain